MRAGPCGPSGTGGHASGSPRSWRRWVPTLLTSFLSVLLVPGTVAQGGTAPGTLDGAVETSVPVWALLGVALYGVSAIVAASYHRSLHDRIPFGGLLARTDRWISRLSAGHVVAASVAAFVGLSAMVLLFGPQARFADPLAYYNSIETMLSGGNPYTEPPSGLIIAYTGVFVGVMTPFVALFGLAGPFIGATFVASFLPISLWAAAKAYVDRRAAAYAGVLGLTLPLFAFSAARWSSDELYVAIAVSLALFLMLEGREGAGFGVAGLLSTKLTVAIPVLGWIVDRGPDDGWVDWLRGGLGRGVAYAVPYLAVFGISTWLWGREYLYGVYWRQTVERAGSRLTSVNLFHLAELASVEPPDWTLVFILAVVALLFLYVLRSGPREPVLTGALVTAGALAVLTSMSVGYMVWLLPFVILYSLRYTGQQTLVSPLFAVGLTFVAHAMKLALYAVPAGLSAYVSGTLAVLITAGLGVTVYHAISIDPGRPLT